MKMFRPSLGSLIIVVMVIAIDLAIVRLIHQSS